MASARGTLPPFYFFFLKILLKRSPMVFQSDTYEPVDGACADGGGLGGRFGRGLYVNVLAAARNAGAHA